MGVNRMPVDPDVGIPDLIHRLKDDSRRLVADEVRLVKLEVRDGVTRSGTGAMWLSVAFGVGVVAAVLATLLVVTLIGRLASGHMWVGAIVTAILELGLAAVFLRKGAAAFKQPHYTLDQTRDTVADTAVWVKSKVG